MQYKYNVIIINITLCDIRESKDLFNNIFLLFRDYFAQTLPIILYGSCIAIINIIIQRIPF